MNGLIDVLGTRTQPARRAQWRTALLAAGCALGAMAPIGVEGAAGEFQLDASRRFLLKGGQPFFYCGDTAWQLFHDLDRGQAETYLQDRARRRFNVIQAVAIAELGGTWRANAYGDLDMAASTAVPITTPGVDPNDATAYDYWDHVDFIVDRANALGMTVGMLPAWGYHMENGRLVFNTQAKAYNYGRFLGERYRNRSIIWILGGDRNVGSGGSEMSLAALREIARGIEDGVGGAGNALITLHPLGGYSSSQVHNEAWMDFNMFQSGHFLQDIWRYVVADYARTPVKPTLDAEPIYERNPIGFNPANGYAKDFHTRRTGYFQVFAGAAGHVYGNGALWQMAGVNLDVGGHEGGVTWAVALNDPGGDDIRHVRALMESRPFLSNQPDQMLFTDAEGGPSDRLQACRGDGYGMIYSSIGRSFTARLGRVSGGTARGWWFNPRDGTATDLGTFSNAGTRFFDPPGGPGNGNDWVLVMDDASRGYGTPGTGIVGGTTAGGTSAGSSTGGGTTGTGGIVDLVVTDIGWEPESPTAGDAVVFRVTVRNAGTAASPAGTTLGVLFLVNGVPQSWAATSAGLAGGGSVTLTAQGGINGPVAWTGVAGNATVRAHVDDLNRIAESNDGNNIVDEVVVVTPAGGTSAGGTSAGGSSAGGTTGTQTPYGGTPVTLPGRIEAEAYDLGGSSIAYQDTTPANQGGQLRTAEAVDIEPCLDAGGGYNVGWIVEGEWLEFTVTVPTAGNYDFLARVARQPAGPAQFRVLVDGAPWTGDLTVPSTGGWQTWTTVSRTGLTLAAGSHVLRFEAIGRDFNVNHFEVRAAVASGGGLRGEYFSNTTLSGGPSLARTDGPVDFNWGTGSPGGGLPADRFSVRWTGSVEPTVTGGFQFQTESDDGMRVWVNDQLVIDRWTDHAPTVDTSGTIQLTAGQRYAVRVEYYENGGGAVARLRWIVPGAAGAVAIPAARLFGP